MTTIVVGYVARPEGHAALQRGIEEARLRNARLLVINSNKGGSRHDVDEAIAVGDELERLREELSGSGVEFDVREVTRGQEVADDLIAMAEENNAEFIVIGLRRRTPVGKLILGSNAQRILLEATCPVLAVKATED